MLSFAPFDEEPHKVDLPTVKKKKAPTKTKSKCPMLSLINLGDDDTECNKLVLIFIMGVIALAITDAIRDS
jgi:hypothetical protein